ncbi:CHASE2 domain-containing protein [Nisaea acidiphila]|uniref:CHASE2 domain-containing protein n=1 Tax=Nisaea acidiphila TaxID=1862145 RepID=A0A9J7AVE1_9PROT|nr:CHASE2 domain-containing protein [Nisaea acidiphila]UUX50770.1 CHASE2 domain-containing protein [Nisaea acidiphila]
MALASRKSWIRKFGALIREQLAGYRLKKVAEDPNWLEKRIIRLGIALAFGSLAFATDLFGLKEVSARYSYWVYNLFSAPFYSSVPKDQEVPLVLIDDADLKGQGWKWPVSYAIHAKVLERILQFEPRAVFVDFLFVDSRDDAKFPCLIKTLERYKDPAKRVVDRSTEGGGRAGLDCETRDLSGVSGKPVPVFVPVEERRRQIEELHVLTRPVLTKIDVNAFQQDSYFLYTGSASKFGKRRHLSPAYALYKDRCAQSGDCLESFHGGSFDDAFAEPLQIQWGLIRSDRNHFLTSCKYDPDPSTEKDGSDPSGLSFFGQVSSTIRGVLPQSANIFLDVAATTLSGGMSEAAEPCPHMPLISVSNLLMEGVQGGVDFEKELGDRIKGKDVVYGQALSAVSAFVQSPTNPPVSSGYRHAMALQNLHTAGADYLRSKITVPSPFEHLGLPPFVFASSTVSYAVFILFAAVHSYTSFSTTHFLKSGGDPILRRLVVLLTANGGYLSALFAIAALQIWAFRLAPLNLLGLFGLIAVVRGATGSYWFFLLENKLVRIYARSPDRRTLRQTFGDSQ